jgi:hypothetical protein
MPELLRRRLASSVEELVRGEPRQRMVPADSASGAQFERVVIDGEQMVLKYQDARDDWLMRSTGDLTGRRFASLWESGILDAMPEVIDHAVVGAAVEGTVGAVLLRDVSAQLLPPGDVVLGFEAHRRFLDHMAALHARFWGWHDDVGLTTLRARYLAFSPAVARAEAERGSELLVPKLMGQGWQRFPRVAAVVDTVVQSLLDDPAPLVAALGAVPHTFVHGDWKAANLGCQPDGRTILLDWGEIPGEASPLADLTWYLALNSARLPEPKDEVVAAYRRTLEAHGVETSGWWEEALALELLGTLVQFGWEKALGGPGEELDWWVKGALQGAVLIE